MSALYVRASALASALGEDVDAAARRLQAAPVPAQAFDGRPYRFIGQDGADWRARAEAITGDVAADLRQRAALREPQWARLPCFIGSSSFSIGASDTEGRSLEPPAAFARALADWFGTSGPVLAVSTACTSGLAALQCAADVLRQGAAPHALVLGVELVNRITPAGFAGLQLLSAEAARPCDRARDGMVLGEALGALVLSTEPSPWRVAALAGGLDPSSVTGPAPGGEAMAAVMREAMRDAGWDVGGVDLVKLQAAGSALADLAEGRAVREVFGRAPRAVSLKGAIGHTLGASGPAELALLLAALEQGRVPPTWGFAEADPEVDLAPAGGPASGVARVLFNLSGFGGSVMTLALERSG